MGTETGPLSSLLAQDPCDVLRRIGDYGQKYGFGNDGGPEVTVAIRSGHSLSGRVVRCDADNGTEFVLLKLGEQRDLNPGLVYLRLDDVIAVQVRLASSVQEIFKTPSPIRAAAGPGPTKLDLKRQLEKLGTTIKLKVEYQWPSGEESETVRAGLAELMPALETAIKKIAGEPLGAAALKKIGIIRLRHSAGAALTVKPGKEDIEITFDLGRPAPSDLNTQLEKSIESAL